MEKLELRIISLIFVLAAIAIRSYNITNMNETHEHFQEIFDELGTLTQLDKTKFLDDLLFYFTIAGRGICSDEQPTDTEKVNAFKWLNELLHRIWNIRSELQNGEGYDFVTRLYDNMKFYSDQSTLLRLHLVPTTLGAFKIFKERQKSQAHHD